jgi:uncharacterized protein (TIGR04255 family)
MFQVGVGIISINHLNYGGFEQFSAACAKVIKALLNEIGTVKLVNRLGLRYINKANLDRNWNQMIDIDVPAPNLIDSNAKVRLFKWLSDFGDTGMLTTSITWPMEEQETEVMIIDLDHYLDLEVELSPDDVMGWLSKAHENIYEVFKNVLQNDYFASLSGD